jgi:hypothetical protein
MKQLISEEQIQAAFDLLHEKSDDIAAARAMQVRTDDRKKAVLSRLILASPERTEQSRKAWATAHPEYAEACEAHAIAEGRWEEMKDRRARVIALLECWRTLEASQRGLARMR